MVWCHGRPVTREKYFDNLISVIEEATSGLPLWIIILFYYDLLTTWLFECLSYCTFTVSVKFCVWSINLFTCNSSMIDTSGFATKHVVVYICVCKTSYHLLISPPPTNLPNSIPAPYHSTYHALQQQRVTLHWREIKLTAKVHRIWRQYTCYFPANGSTNTDVFFSLKHFASQGKSYP